MLEKMVVKQFKHWHCCHSIEYPSQVTWLFIWNGVNVTVVFLAKMDKIKSPYSIHRRRLSFVESKENTKQMLDEKWNKEKRRENVQKVNSWLQCDYGKGTRPSKTMNKTRIIRHRRLNIKHKVNVIQKQQRHDKVSFYLTRPDSFERTISPFEVNHTEKSFRFCRSKQSKALRTPQHSTEN